MKQILIFTLLIFTFISCTDYPSGPETERGVDAKVTTPFSDLEVSERFSWSNSRNITIDVELPNTLLDSTHIEASLSDGTMLSRLNVQSDEVSFNITVPSYISTIYLYSSSTDVTKEVKAITGSVLFDGYGVEDIKDTKEFPLFSVTYQFHMFEDLWPGVGDYDFNDYVFRTTTVYIHNKDNKIESGEVELVYLSNGTYKHYGVGVEFLGAEGKERVYLEEGFVTFSGDVKKDPLSPNTALVVQNLNNHTPQWDAFGPSQSILYSSFRFDIEFEKPLRNQVIGNYFLFDANHRQREIHTAGNPPTQSASLELFGTSLDASEIDEWDRTPGRSFSIPAPFYKTDKFLPFGITVTVSPSTEPGVVRQSTELTTAYPFFSSWVESEGIKSRSW